MAVSPLYIKRLNSLFSNPHLVSDYSCRFVRLAFIVLNQSKAWNDEVVRRGDVLIIY